MSSKLLSVSLCLALCVTALPASGQDQVVMPKGVAALSEAEIQAEIIGNTVTGYAGGSRFTEYYAPDQTISGIQDGERYGGSWEIKNGQMCYDFDDGDEFDGCWTIALDGESISYFTAAGTPDGGARLIRGNPNSF